MRQSWPFYFLPLLLGLVVATASHADLTVMLESPAQTQHVSGIGTISGWAFSSAANAQVTVQLRIDGVSQNIIPCCVDRSDVAQQFPDMPQALRSGFGLLYNFNLLSAGTHTIAIEVHDDAESLPQTQEYTITVIKPGGFEFLSDLNLSAASNIKFTDDRWEVIIEGVEVEDKETEKKQKVNLHVAWQENIQTVGITQSENVGNPEGGKSEDDEDEDGEDDEDSEDDENDEQNPVIVMTLENPSGGALGISTSTVSGIGIVSGWTFTETPGAEISDIRLRIDGESAGDIPCCSERQDVQAAFPELSQALQSGFGALTNFSLLDPGSHTLTVEVQDSSGLTQTVNRSVSTVKLGNSEFLDQFDLSAAAATIDGGTLFLDYVKIRDKASQQTSQISVGYSWEESCQCFVAQPGCGNGTIESGEECDGATLDRQSCTSLGFSSGTLTCRPLCEEDEANCPAPCFFELKDCSGGVSVYVSNTASNTVSVISTLTDEVTATIKVGKEPRGLAVSPDGSVVYVTNFQDDTVSVIATATNTVSATVAVGNGPLGVAFSPDSTKAYIVNGLAGTVSVLETTTRKLVAAIQVGHEPQAIALTTDGKWAYVTNYADNTVTILDLATNRLATTLLAGKGPSGIAVSPDNSAVYVVNYNSNTVSVLDRASNTVTGTVTVGFQPTRVTFSAAGDKAFVASSVSKTVSAIDTADLTIEDTIAIASGDDVPTRPDGVVVTTGGTRLYVTLFGDGFGSTLQVVSTATGGTLKVITVGEGPSAVMAGPVPSSS
jgi:YVTN family beta-propeller protein